MRYALVAAMFAVSCSSSEPGDVLATDVDAPVLQSDGTTLFWLEAPEGGGFPRRIRATPVTGGEITTVYGYNDRLQPEFNLVGVDEARIYLTEAGQLYSIAKNGGGKERLSDGVGSVSTASLQRSTLYWSVVSEESYGSKVSYHGRSTTPGSTPWTIAEGPSSPAFGRNPTFAATKNGVFVSESLLSRLQFFRAGNSTGEFVDLPDYGVCDRLVSDGEVVYCTTPNLTRHVLRIGEDLHVVPLEDSPDYVGTLAVDSGFLYLAGTGIWKRPVAGGPSEIVITTPARNIAIDANAIYWWSGSGHTIYRKLK